MGKFMFMTYNNAGGIDEIIKRNIHSVNYFRDINSIINYYRTIAIQNHYQKLGNNWNVKPYAYDERIGKHVMMLTVDHSGYKNQFICYIVVDEVN